MYSIVATYVYIYILTQDKYGNTVTVNFHTYYVLYCCYYRWDIHTIYTCINTYIYYCMTEQQLVENEYLKAVSPNCWQTVSTSEVFSSYVFSLLTFLLYRKEINNKIKEWNPLWGNPMMSVIVLCMYLVVNDNKFYKWFKMFGDV